MKKVTVPALLILLAATPFAAASGGGEGDRLGVAGRTMPVFAWMTGPADPFSVEIGQGARRRARELGVELRDIAPQGLAAAAADGRFDLLLAVPSSPVEILKVHALGIPVILCGDGMEKARPGFPLARVSDDLESAGYELGRRLVETSGGRGSIALFGSPTYPVAAGFLRAVREAPEVRLVGGEASPPAAVRSAAAALLRVNPGLKGLFVVDPGSVRGVVEAVAEAGLRGKVKLAAVGSEPAGSAEGAPGEVESLRAGELDLLLALRPRETGYLALSWGYLYLSQGDRVPERVVPGFSILTREEAGPGPSGLPRGHAPPPRQ